MSKLKAKTRNAFADRVFGLLGQRKYPMPNKPANAARIRAKANKILGR